MSARVVERSYPILDLDVEPGSEATFEVRVDREFRPLGYHFPGAAFRLFVAISFCVGRDEQLAIGPVPFELFRVRRNRRRILLAETLVFGTAQTEDVVSLKVSHVGGPEMVCVRGAKLVGIEYR